MKQAAHLVTASCQTAVGGVELIASAQKIALRKSEQKRKARHWEHIYIAMFNACLYFIIFPS